MRIRSARCIVAAAFLANNGFGLCEQASADQMTGQSLEENRQACMTACSKRTGDASSCTAYCNCATKGLAERMTEEEYQAGKIAIRNKQRPADESIEKALAIAQSCTAAVQ
jgi:hypothetical protein